MTDFSQNKINDDAAAAFVARADDGPVRMLNLLKFVAGGDETYKRYAAAVGPLLAKAGGRALFTGRPAELMIGDETWDLVIIVEYPTRGAFLAMAGSEAYQAIAHLRAEALERSVLYALDPAELG